MTEPIDEYSVSHLREYQGHELISITKETVDLCESEEEKNFIKEAENKFETLCKVIKDILNKYIEKVSVTNRLVVSPCCIVCNQYSMSGNMERISRAQALRTQPSKSLFGSKKMLEINPNNNIINKLRELVDEDRNSKFVRDLTWILYETALLQSGFSLEEPSVHSDRIYQMIMMGLNIEQEVETAPFDATEVKQLKPELIEKEYQDLFAVD